MTKTYRCFVSDRQGKKDSILLEAADYNDLLRHFSDNGNVLISYEEAKPVHTKTGKVRISMKSVIGFTESMASLLRSGLSVQESLKVCAKIDTSEKNAMLCGELLRALERGESLHEALAPFFPSFSSLYITLVGIGEAVGSITEVFDRLAQYLRVKRETRQKIIQALIYPLTVFATALGVIACILFFVFPRLQNVFAVFTESNGEVAEGINGVYRAITVWTVGIAVLLVSVVLVLIVYRVSEKSARRIDGMLLRLPFVGYYIKTICTSDFVFSMELLCASGVPVVEALRRSADAAGNGAYRAALIRVSERLEEGNKLSESFAHAKVIPQYVVTWTGIGEATGSIQTVFSQLRRYYEKETIHIVTSLTASAEPVFILLTGVLLLILVGQFVLPVFSLLGAL